MAFTYSASEASALHQVRGLVGDTVDAGHFLEDETITAILASKGDEPGPAAVECVRRILAKIAKEVDRSHPDGISSQRSQRSQHYRDLLRELEGLYGRGLEVEVFAGGTSQSENDAFDANPDNVAGRFDVDMWSGSRGSQR